MSISGLGFSIASDIGKLLEPSSIEGFSRLKSIFTSGQNYNNYGKIVSSAKNKILGNIPKELIQFILKKSPASKSDCIKELQQTFGNLAKQLKSVERAEIDSIKNLSSKEEEMNFLLKRLFPSLDIPEISAQSLKIIEKTNAGLAESFSNVLQTKCGTKLEFLGSGQYGNAYKMELFNEAGQSIMHNRVLKVFKKPSSSVELAVLKRKKIQELLPKYSDSELFEIYKALPQRSTGRMKIKMSDEQKYRRFTETMQNNRLKYQQMDLEDVEEDFMQQFLFAQSEHGLCAEANNAFRLKHILGHDISKTDIVDADMFDLDIGYSISQFSDGLLPKIKSRINFSDLGLVYGDMKHDNLINGRMIDFGGIFKSTEALSDNTVLKYYKKIMNRSTKTEQLEMIKRFQEEIKNPKCPLRDKISEAITLAEIRIHKGFLS